MLITKEVKIKMNSKWRKRYNDLGYFYNIGEEMIVKIEDVPLKSGVKVEFTCDYCGEISETPYSSYNKKTIIDKDCCKNCKIIKMNESLFEIYGENNANKITSVRDKIEKTNIERYGHSSALRNKEVMKKLQKTNIKKYGVDNVMKVDKIKKKCFDSINKNNSQCYSSQQKAIHDALGGEMNYLFDHFWLDIYFSEEKIYLEYDGGGHDLKVKFGYMSREEFDTKQMKRNYYLKQRGLKCIRIISSKNKYPNDEILLSIKKYAKDLFENENRSWVTFNIDENLIQYKNKIISYDFSHTLSYN